MKLKLSETIVSPEDLRSVISELKDYSKWLNKTAIKKRVTNKSDTNRPELSDAASDLMNQWQDKKELEARDIDKLIYELESYLSKVPTIRVTFAALPTTKTKQQFTEWFRNNLNQNVLVDFRFNSSLLGGMVVNCGSHIYDWSFRRELLSNKDKFVEVLHRV